MKTGLHHKIINADALMDLPPLLDKATQHGWKVHSIFTSPGMHYNNYPNMEPTRSILYSALLQKTPEIK